MGNERLRRYLGEVMADAASLGIDLPVVVDIDPEEFPGPEAAYLDTQDGGCSVWLNADLSEAEQFVMVADQFHDWLVETLPSHRLASNWPPCPWHPASHPLTVRAEQDSAVWACPRTPRVVAHIGDLATAD